MQVFMKNWNAIRLFQFLAGIDACLFSDGRGDYLPYSNNKFLWKKQQAGIKRNAEANQASDLDQRIVPVSSPSSVKTPTSSIKS